MEVEIGGRLLAAIGAIVFGMLVERWWHYASRRRP
jgi:hypothetical protein